MLTKKDIINKNKYVIVDKTLAQKAYKRDNIINKEILLYVNNVPQYFKIIGVIEGQNTGIKGIYNEQIPDFLYIPYTTASYIKNSDNIDQIFIKTSKDKDSEKLKKQISYFLTKKNNGENLFDIQNMNSYKEKINIIIKQITLLLSFIAAISLIVAGVGVVNIMLSIVSERKKEIGICKAIGANNSQIALLFLTEALIISIIGGIVGIILGGGLSVLLLTILKIQIIIKSSSIILSQLIAILTGVLFGIIPAIKASRLNPIDAFKE
jgi:putative ABC transport system permease protein